MSQPAAYRSAPLVRPTSGAAVTGFVLALLGLSLPGLVVAAIATRRTKTGERGGHGLAVAGIVIGAIGTVVWTIALAPWLLLPFAS